MKISLRNPVPLQDPEKEFSAIQCSTIWIVHRFKTIGQWNPKFNILIVTSKKANLETNTW